MGRFRKPGLSILDYRRPKLRKPRRFITALSTQPAMTMAASHSCWALNRRSAAVRARQLAAHRDRLLASLAAAADHMAAAVAALGAR